MEPAPEPHPELAIQRRLESAEESVRAGAGWELELRRRLDAAGLSYAAHPAIPGLTRTPDLLVQGRGMRTYLEATATGGGSLTGYRQTEPEDRIHDVLLSRLKHKSRAFQGIDGPLVVCVLALWSSADGTHYDRALDEFLAAANERNRNVSAVVVESSTPAGPAAVRHNGAALHPLPTGFLEVLQAARRG